MSTARILLFPLFVLAWCCGCVMSKKDTDRTRVAALKKDPDRVKEAAAFAISATLESGDNPFYADNIIDPVMRKRIRSLGDKVSVHYRPSAYYPIPDSIVVFGSTSFFGLEEVLYDFAAADRSFPDSVQGRTYLFTRVASRIYYRRTPVPMM